MSGLALALQAEPLLDHHAHNLLLPEHVASQPYPAFFSESPLPGMIEHARHSLFFRRSLRDLAALLGCEPNEGAVWEARCGRGHQNLVRLCLEEAHLEAIFLDDGLTPERVHPLDWHRSFVPVRRILRLEWLAEHLSMGCSSFDSFETRLRQELAGPAVVAFKSIAAYRTGLRLEPGSRKAAAGRYRPDLGRLEDPILISFVLECALEEASRRQVPVQFHTGFGDPDLDLALADPLHLRPWLQRFPEAPVVLLHASYPFARQAGYLASVYPQVYLDFGLAIPFLSVTGMRSALSQLMELAPLSKILYSSDASRIPELFYLGARWGRICLLQVLEQGLADGDLTPIEAEKAGRALLSGNARHLYGKVMGTPE